MYNVQESMIVAQRAMYTQLNVLSSDLARVQKMLESKAEKRTHDGDYSGVTEVHSSRISPSPNISRQYFSSFSTNSPGYSSPSPTPPIDLKGALITKSNLRDISDVAMYPSHSYHPSLSALSALNALTALEALNSLTVLTQLSESVNPHSSQLTHNPKGQSVASLHDDAYVGSPTISYH